MNCMVMLDAADLGPLLQYQACMERMLERYGERAWALLHQADVRARLEEWPLADRDRFWTEELIEPALIVMAGRTALKTLVQDDARTSRPKFAADLKPPLADASAATIRPRNTNRSGHVHETSEGRYLKNRTGHSLCPDFRATCTQTIQGTWCIACTTWCTSAPDVWDGTLSKCPHPEMPTAG